MEFNNYKRYTVDSSAVFHVNWTGVFRYGLSPGSAHVVKVGIRGHLLNVTSPEFGLRTEGFVHCDQESTVQMGRRR
jgi:hypothetical protein